MFNTARAELVTGTLAVAASSGWMNDILPIISEIGVVAGTVVALHGLFKICYGYYKMWQYKKNGNH